LVHHAPGVAAAMFPHGQGLVEVVYASTEVRPELQKKVDFGPFKVTVDDGLPLRKSAYSCLSAMLENAPDLLGSVSGQLMPCVARGLDDSPEDAPDIPFVCHQILLQLCARYPLAVLSQSAILMKQFQKTLRLKLDAKDQEKLERRTSILKSAIRTLDQICALPGALEDRDVAETVSVLQKTDYLKQMAVDDGLKNVFKRASEA
jgi:cullin-associated NEDD8-dissociated protein 1